MHFSRGDNLQLSSASAISWLLIFSNPNRFCNSQVRAANFTLVAKTAFYTLIDSILFKFIHIFNYRRTGTYKIDKKT